MRAFLLLLLACGMWFSLVVGAFALDQFGLSGRIVGAIMLAVAFWGSGLLRASQRMVEGPEDEVGEPPTNLAIEEACEPEPARPWWRRRYTLTPAQVLLLSGLCGAVVGCVVPIYLNELRPLSFLVWGGSYGVLSVIVVATIRLQNERHPHHSVFMASVSHALRLAFLALFVLGFWQGRSTSFVLTMLVLLQLGITFTLGAFWSFALMVRSAVRRVVSPDAWSESEVTAQRPSLPRAR